MRLIPAICLYSTPCYVNIAAPKIDLSSVPGWNGLQPRKRHSCPKQCNVPRLRKSRSVADTGHSFPIIKACGNVLSTSREFWGRSMCRGFGAGVTYLGTAAGTFQPDPRCGDVNPSWTAGVLHFSSIQSSVSASNFMWIKSVSLN